MIHLHIIKCFLKGLHIVITQLELVRHAKLTQYLNFLNLFIVLYDCFAYVHHVHA